MRAIVALYRAIAINLLAITGFLAVVGLQLGWIRGGNQNPYPATVDGSDSVSMEVTGHQPYFSDMIPVDPSKLYRLSGLFRNLSDDRDAASVSEIYLGVRLYDKDQAPLLGRDGAYRYPAANGLHITRLDGWVRIAGDITGESEEGQNSFKPGTRWVRVILVPNYRSRSVKLEFSDVEFSEVVHLNNFNPR